MYSFSFTSLIVFCEVVKNKSISRAAEKLFMTQPGVSHHVSQLEEQTGHQLLIRQKGKCMVTKEGKTLFRYAEKLQKAAQGVEETIHGLRKDIEPTLHIGTTVTYSQLLMPSLLDNFQKVNPHIKIKLDAGSSQEMLETVLSGKNDICVVACPVSSKKLFAFPVAGEELVLITNHDHPLARKKTVSLAEIGNYPFIVREEGSATRQVVTAALAEINIKSSVIIEAKSSDFIKEWVSQGKGISILIRRAITEEDKKFLALTPFDHPLYLEVSALCLKSRRYNRHVQAFFEHLRETQFPSFA